MCDITGIDIARSAHRWGIVLAGGNGTRLRDLVYRKRADYLPKQYLNFIGKRSMLEHTKKLIVRDLGASAHLPSARVLREPQQVCHGLNKVTGSSALENRRMAMKES